jgi:hypothetical protein
LQTSESAITDTLAKNCPILKTIIGSFRTVHFERDPTTDKFQPKFDSAATNSTIDPDDMYHMHHVLGLHADIDDGGYDNDDYCDEGDLYGGHDDYSDEDYLYGGHDDYCDEDYLYAGHEDYCDEDYLYDGPDDYCDEDFLHGGHDD